MGSSPRMRGAQRILDDPIAVRGIIPADAGSTTNPGRPDRSPGDHPRGCGEHRPMTHVSIHPQGSSPRMRGALFMSISGLGAVRIIPADAGSTWTVDLILCHRQDHPRGCGEHPTRPYTDFFG